MKVLFTLLIASLFFVACSPINKYIRKAGTQTSKGDLEKARQYYLKAYNLDSNSYKANVGLGITLSEFMGKHQEALPYLKNAERLSKKDTLEDLFYALGKSYHYQEQFDEALINYHKMQRYSALQDDDKLFHLELDKAIEDCKYAQSHTDVANPKDYYIANVGSKINTAVSEYVPVLTQNNELLFTSKRKDDKKEKINPLDGEYFESMYLSKIENGRYSEPRRYTIPDMYLKSAYKKGHESIVSMSPDGKKVFVFQNSKLYESDMTQATTKPVKLSKKVNLDYYQNHAYLTKDGKTLFFTSEQAKGSVGGNDIYKVIKQEDGTWGEPENLGTTINTKLNEDAPYLSDDDKTLYFASNGHPGYGGYDIYKSNFENGNWTEPVNLGKPLNTVGNDIFLTNSTDQTSGYFSSNRMGGKGGMDIYKINYKPTSDKDCPTIESDLINITVLDTDPYDFKQQIAFEFNDAIKNKVLNYTWIIGTDTIISKEESFSYDFKDSGTYPIKLRAVSWCDTCVEPMVSCKQVTTTFKTHPKDPLLTKDIDINAITGQLTKEQLLALGFDLTIVYFDLNKYTIRTDALPILAKNVELLKKYPMLHLDIVGNTDARGSSSYNLQLSKQRALSVKNYLIENGISKKRIIKLEAKGETQLVNNCLDATCDEAQHQLNRRAEFKVSK